MDGGSGTWDISHLADLIIGPHAEESSASSDVADPAFEKRVQPIPPPTAPAGIQSVALLTTDSDSVQFLRNYANYWSNRGERTIVIQPLPTGFLLECFDCRGAGDWFESVRTYARQRQFDELANWVYQHVDRLVLAVDLSAKLCQPTLRITGRVCVLIRALPDSLVRGYESLKHLWRAHPEVDLSCFVLDCDYAQEAERLASKLEHMGARFLGTVVSCDGFNMRRTWISDNLAGQVHLPGDAFANQNEYFTWLKACLGQARACQVPPVLVTDHEGQEPETYDQDEPVRSIFPVLKALRVRGPITTSAQLDRAIAESLNDIVDDALSSWPVSRGRGDDCSFRLVQRRLGNRALIVSTVACPTGRLEQALALLYPHEPTDVLIMVSAAMSMQLVQAASVLGVQIRLYEVAQAPPRLAMALCLREVYYQEAVVSPTA